MYEGAAADMGLSTDPYTGGRYTFGAGNPITNIELDGHMLVAPSGGGCSSAMPGCPGYHASATTSSSGDRTYNAALCGRVGGSYCAGAPPLPRDAPGGSVGFLAGIGDSLVSLLDVGMAAANPIQGARNFATGNTFSGAYTRWVARHGVNTSSHSTYTGGIWAGAVLQMGAGGLLGAEAAAGGAAEDASVGQPSELPRPAAG
jgi:hypothetical protein